MPLKALTVILVIGAILVTGALYYPGKDGPFVLDDSSSIAANLDIRVNAYTKATFKDAAYSMNRILHSDSIIPIRALSYLSFALNFYFADDIISAFKLTNIFLHLLTGIIVFLLARKILELSDRTLNTTCLDGLSLLACFVWLTHPLYVSTVLYITQRMTILSAFFSFMGVLAFIQYRTESLTKNTSVGRAIVTVGACTICAYFSKETGALVPVYCLAIELIYFRFKFPRPTPSTSKILHGVCLLLPTFLILGYLGNSYLHQIVNPAVTRQFDVNQRLMTEARVLWQYLSYLFLVEPQGISFHHDNTPISTSLLSPISTLTSLLAWLLVIGITLFCIVKNKAKLFSFAVLWYLTGHLLESTVLNLEIAFEHRNYAPGIGVILFAIVNLFYLFKKILKHDLKSLLTIAILSLTVPFLLHELVAAWKDNKSLTIENYARAPDSPRAMFQMAKISLRENEHEKVTRFLNKIRKIDNREVGYNYFEIAHLCKKNLTIPDTLIAETMSKLDSGIPTVLSFNTFNNVIKQCNQGRYDATLTSMYTATGKSSFSRLSANGLVMLARTQKRALDETRYFRLMQQAREAAMTFEVNQELRISNTKPF